MSTTTTSPTTLPLLEICRAVYNLKEIPADLDLYEEDAVEEYKYRPPFQWNSIEHLDTNHISPL